MTTKLQGGIICPNCGSDGAWAVFDDPGFGEYMTQSGLIRCLRCNWNQSVRPIIRKNQMNPVPADKANGINYPSTSETVFAVGAYGLLGLLVLGAIVSACLGVWKIFAWLAGMIF